ncbi:MAG: fused MFS/spermidine synthase [Elusimicrobiota bacterium]|nr:fused MFS/spermidine synthase [Elusimicrobiota bacterium]
MLPTASKLTAAVPGLLFSFAAFLGSFLLFQLELVAGQTVLPHYGGSYYVWTVCLLFYQIVLVAGYAYALLLSERFSPKVLLRVHLVLLAAALAFMPASFPPQVFGSPVLDLLGRLTLFIAFPFLLLSASTTLCHKLLSDASGRSTYSVFAWSNAGSLAGMLSYALLLEPALPLSSTALLWRGLFAVYALLFAAALLLGFHKNPAPAEAAAAEKPRYFLWFILPAGTAALLAAVTSYQSSATASMPLTWMIPLCAYLLSYAVLFAGGDLRVNTLRISLFSLLAIIAGLLWRLNSPLTTVLLAFLNWALFFACIVAHRELYMARPRSAALAPRYYLMMGLGGVAGTALVTPVGALRLSFGFADLYIALILLVGALAYAISRERGLGLRAIGFAAALLGGLLTLGLKLSGETRVYGIRNFYGIYRVEDDKAQGLRRFIHGSTVHGIQHLAAGEELKTTVYYSAGSPISEVLKTFPAAHVGAVGLGIGVSCADARKGTEWVFYELDPDVVHIARKYFTFLEKCKADVSIVTGDARLNLLKEPPGRFDLLYLDAFTGGSVPFHLLTREALELYRSRLKPGGMMIFHVSANFLDIIPVLRLSASAAGLQSLAKTASFDPDDPSRFSSEWLAVTNNPAYLKKLAKTGWTAPPPPKGWKVWTDDYRNVLKALKW